MKTIKLLVMIFSILTITYGSAQKDEVKEIKDVITKFSKAGDENNTDQLASYLDDNYRVVMNRLFGSQEVSILSRAVYLEKIKTKEFGGDKRELTISNVVVNGNTASARVTFKGSKMTFISIIVLVKDTAGNWKLISDTPTIQK